MSERLVFDTHRFVRDMVSAGMAEPIAETLADKQLEMLTGDLATRVEIAQIEVTLKIELAATNERIAQVEAGLKTELAATKTSLVKWMVTIMTAYTAAIAALVSALARSLAG